MKVRENKKQSQDKIILINYSDNNYRRSQNTNTKTALNVGGFSKVISYNPKDIDENFYDLNKKILSLKRGGGYWLWKPYIIKKTLDQLEWNDYLFYSDAGCYFIDSIHHLKNSIQQDIIPFELKHIEKKWTKRDAFLLMNCDAPNYFETKQRLASYSLWKKTPLSMRFINEWLELCTDERLITDSENTLEKENFDGFVEHRHDQSIFSLLTKKYNLEGYRNPSQFGNEYFELYKNSSYPQLLVHNRQRDIIQKVKGRINKWLKIN